MDIAVTYGKMTYSLWHIDCYNGEQKLDDRNQS